MTQAIAQWKKQVGMGCFWKVTFIGSRLGIHLFEVREQMCRQFLQTQVFVDAFVANYGGVHFTCLQFQVLRIVVHGDQLQ